MNDRNPVPSHGSYEGTKLYEIEQRVKALERAVEELIALVNS